ncbi:MAG: hypothetical protein ACJAVT_001632 [Yoonia sp.]|jgi:hypothetical protein
MFVVQRKCCSDSCRKDSRIHGADAVGNICRFDAQGDVFEGEDRIAYIAREYGVFGTLAVQGVLRGCQSLWNRVSRPIVASVRGRTRRQVSGHSPA